MYSMKQDVLSYNIIMNRIEEIIKKNEHIALSNYEIIEKLNGKVNIVLYPDLYKYTTIDQVLGKYGVAVLLFESRPKYGHWVCIFKIDNDTIEFFNPYGGYPDDSLLLIKNKYRKESNQIDPVLSYLLLKCSYKLNYNEFQFQTKNSNIQTCGRHCIVRILFKNIDIYSYYEILDFLRKKWKITFDEIVTLLTL